MVADCRMFRLGEVTGNAVCIPQDQTRKQVQHVDIDFQSGLSSDCIRNDFVVIIYG